MTSTLSEACLAGGKRFVYTSGYFNYVEVWSVGASRVEGGPDNDMRIDGDCPNAPAFVAQRCPGATD